MQPFPDPCNGYFARHGRCSCKMLILLDCDAFSSGFHLPISDEKQFARLPASPMKEFSLHCVEAREYITSPALHVKLNCTVIGIIRATIIHPRVGWIIKCIVRVTTNKILSCFFFPIADERTRYLSMVAITTRLLHSGRGMWYTREHHRTRNPNIDDHLRDILSLIRTVKSENTP